MIIVGGTLRLASSTTETVDMITLKAFGKAYVVSKNPLSRKFSFQSVVECSGQSFFFSSPVYRQLSNLNILDVWTLTRSFQDFREACRLATIFDLRRS